ncbi:Uncharacterised protein [Mycobacteroides abscessus subsp. abscessus]|nr:Uncharacterised protein [Mycobacteroides abscessus subsp. abscessus]
MPRPGGSGGGAPGTKPPWAVNPAIAPPGSGAVSRIAPSGNTSMSSANPHDRLPPIQCVFIRASEPAGRRMGAATNEPTSRASAIPTAVTAIMAGPATTTRRAPGRRAAIPAAADSAATSPSHNTG